MAVGRSLDLQPLNPVGFRISQIWRHRTHHGYHSNVAPWDLFVCLFVFLILVPVPAAVCFGFEFPLALNKEKGIAPLVVVNS